MLLIISEFGVRPYEKLVLGRSHVILSEYIQELLTIGQLLAEFLLKERLINCQILTKWQQLDEQGQYHHALLLVASEDVPGVLQVAYHRQQEELDVCQDVRGVLATDSGQPLVVVFAWRSCMGLGAQAELKEAFEGDECLL